MNAEQLERLKHPPLLVSNLDIFKDLVSYGKHPGVFPAGSRITITGAPGTGKTKYALQLLDSIAQCNEVECVYNGYEQVPAVIADYVRALGLKKIEEYNLEGDAPEFHANEVHVIDSLDAFAAQEYGLSYPDTKMAERFKLLGTQNITIISVHHKVGVGNKESGSAKFNQYTDIVIELKKSMSGNVVASTTRKNRYPGKTSSIDMKHTKQGLVVAPSPWQAFADWAQSVTLKRRF